MPKLKSTYSAKDARVQILLPSRGNDVEPILVDLDGCGVKINHNVIFADGDTEMDGAPKEHSITGTFEFIERHDNQNQMQILSSEGMDKAIRAMADEVVFLRKSEGIRLIRFSKRKK